MHRSSWVATLPKSGALAGQLQPTRLLVRVYSAAPNLLLGRKTFTRHVHREQRASSRRFSQTHALKASQEDEKQPKKEEPKKAEEKTEEPKTEEPQKGEHKKEPAREEGASDQAGGRPPPPGAPPPGPSIHTTAAATIYAATLTTMVGLSMVFIGGIAYVSWYKRNVLDKMEQAFAAGYDPALELSIRSKKVRVPGVPDEIDWDMEGPWSDELRRKEQDTVDSIVHGTETGHYFMLLGPKGTGKTTMIYNAMHDCNAEGVAMCEAHPDLEVFRLRLGKALNYEFFEDTQTGVFQRRDPREGGAALDIERALNKLEKVALKYSAQKNRPLVLILNNIHHFKNDDEGRNMLLQFQQRAEAWAASRILTIVFSSDDFWPFFVMRNTGSRMRVVSIYDLDASESLRVANRIRLNAGREQEDMARYKQVICMVGGRLSYLGRAVRSKNMVLQARHMLDVEKAWLLSQIGLIEDHDDDVMDEQKWSSCSWLLLREFVKMRQEQEREMKKQIEAGKKTQEDLEALPLPRIQYYKCRQIMTRTDFLEELDRANIISIDINHDVTPDSVLLLNAAREVVEEEGFDKALDAVRGRIDEIESLHRTRELTFKDIKEGDRVVVMVNKNGGVQVEEGRAS